MEQTRRAADAGTIVEGTSHRGRAESRIRKEPAVSGLSAPAEADAARLPEELRTHEVEPRLQNEELCQDRRRLEATVRKYWALFNNAPIGYVTLDARGGIMEANLSAAELLGCDRGLLIGRSLHYLVTSASRAELGAFLYQLQVGGLTQSCEVELALPGTNRQVIELKGAPTNDIDSGPLRLLIAMVDITRRRMAEEALLQARKETEQRVADRTRELAQAHAQLRDSESRLMRAQSVAKIGVWECNLKERRSLLSDQVYELLELRRDDSAPIFETLQGLIHPDDQHLLTAVTRQDWALEHKFELQLRVFTGKMRTLRHLQVCGEVMLDPVGAPAMVIGTVQDITILIQAQQDRLHFEQQLCQAQKMESLGLMAGGIAHDFNNFLQGILGYVEFAILKAEPDSAIQPFLKGIRSTTVRLSELTRQLLTYSSKGRASIGPVSLNQLVVDMSRLLTLSLPKKAKIAYELSEKLPTVDGDSVQLGQVFMNLITNAGESLGNGAGTILVRSGTLYWDGSERDGLAVARELPNGTYVFLEVSDSGCGMDAETKRRIFEPFFSTKFVGRGLGLSILLGIVHNHGGGLQLWSQPGQGTRFRVLLPGGSESSVEHAPHSYRQELWHGSGLVLLADDEPVVRYTTSAMLQRMGFNVTLAVDGEMAIGIMQKYANEVRLVLLDINMPRMDGLEVIRIIHKRWPGTKIILASGYAVDAATLELDAGNAPSFLQKPYCYGKLVEVVRTTLTGKSAANAQSLSA